MADWRSMETAPKDEKPFIAWYDSDFGPPFGAMAWRSHENKGKGGFHSFTMGTRTMCAVAWMRPKGPK